MQHCEYTNVALNCSTAMLITSCSALLAPSVSSRTVGVIFFSESEELECMKVLTPLDSVLLAVPPGVK